MALLRFQCPGCGFGEYEVGHLTADDEIYCVVCFEEESREVRLERWAEGEGVRRVCALWRPEAA
jgi:hypothetical protein